LACCAVGYNKFTGQVHVQFFGHQREHGWVGDKWVMPYKGVAAFEAEAEVSASMKVKPSRRAVWDIAVSAAEHAIPLDRLDRIRLLTYMYEPVPLKIALSPKKQKRLYQRSVKASVGGDTSAVIQEDASPPQKKCRRKSSMLLKPENDLVSENQVSSSSADCYTQLMAVENAVSCESASAAGKNTNGKNCSLH